MSASGQIASNELIKTDQQVADVIPISLETQTEAKDTSFVTEDKFLDDSKNKHPKVTGAANYVTLEVRNNNDYFGPLFIGSEYREERVLYDTASSWVTVNDIKTKNAEIMSNYDITESTKANPVYLDTAKTEMATSKIDHGLFWLEGTQYTDNICLYQNRVERRDETGRLCVRNMPFLSVNKINGPFKAMGIVGLAPSKADSP